MLNRTRRGSIAVLSENLVRTVSDLDVNVGVHGIGNFMDKFHVTVDERQHQKEQHCHELAKGHDVMILSVTLIK